MNGMCALFAAAALAGSLALPGSAAAQLNEGGRAFGAGAAAGNTGMLPTQRGGANGEPGNERGNGAAVERHAGGATDTVRASSALISRVQQTLNVLGYSAQPLTGTWNRDTAFAMRYFQADHGLPPTGELNRASLEALGLIPPRAAAANGGGGAGAANRENGSSLSALGPSNGTRVGDGGSAGERRPPSSLR